MAKRTIYKWGNKSLEEETFKINNKKVTATRVVSRNAIIIIPILKGDKIVLERQYRKGVKKWIYELPAGGIEKGEKPINAVKRELQEEVGYFPRKVKYLFKAYINPGLETELDYYFVVTDLVNSRKEMDDDEVIDKKIVSVPELIKMVNKNQILDGTSLAGILYYLYNKNKINQILED
ncbi:MAG: NUDIX hydrolase [Candidatus Micrarchaeota archaeon]|nr:NUDIX hydrolase [Candidatus Micrarchaeota archaeon]